MLQQVKTEYQADVNRFNYQYAQVIFDVIKKTK
jgi:hypothetical protein